jgi:hypothetical protein
LLPEELITPFIQAKNPSYIELESNGIMCS